MDNKTVGELLTEAMRSEGITQAGLGHIVGVSTAMISAVCNGKSPLPVALAARIGQELGLGFGEELVRRKYDIALARDLDLYNNLTKGE